MAARRVLVGRITRHATGVSIETEDGRAVHGTGWGRTYPTRDERLDVAFRIAERKLRGCVPPCTLPYPHPDRKHLDALGNIW